MDSNSPLLIAGIIVCICFSALFSATETAFSSMNRIRMKSWADDGNKRAEEALALAGRFDKLLSSVLIGNNVVNIAASTMGTLLFVRYWPKYGAVMSTAVITIVVLIFAEISPKTIAKAKPESFAMAMTSFVHVLMILFTPLTSLFSLWQKMLDKVFHLSRKEGITEEELITIVDQAETEGGLDEDESELIRSAIEFNDREVSEILVPRVDMVAAQDNISMEELSDLFMESGFSRIPIYHETIDDIVGCVHEKDLHAAIRKGEEELSMVITPVIFTAETTKISDLLKILQQAKSHIVIVVDEFGGTDGMVTMEDILEELVGEIWDEHDEVVEEFRKQEDGTYLISCSASLDDMFEYFNLEDDEDEFDCSTVSGWVLAEFGRVPEPGDHFTYKNMNVIVTKVENRRVLEILAAVIPEEKDEKESK